MTTIIALLLFISLLQIFRYAYNKKNSDIWIGLGAIQVILIGVISLLCIPIYFVEGGRVKRGTTLRAKCKQVRTRTVVSGWGKGTYRVHIHMRDLKKLGELEKKRKEFNGLVDRKDSWFNRLFDLVSSPKDIEHVRKIEPILPGY